MERGKKEFDWNVLSSTHNEPNVGVWVQPPYGNVLKLYDGNLFCSRNVKQYSVSATIEIEYNPREQNIIETRHNAT